MNYLNMLLEVLTNKGICILYEQFVHKGCETSKSSGNTLKLVLPYIKDI